jgi:hypothetical protein
MKLTDQQLARFWDKTIQMPNGCIKWGGASNNRGIRGVGYGLFKIPKTRKNITAHRLAYILANGEIPEGQWVLHKCDNPKCVNADHLFLGTAADNVADMDSKGRRVNADNSGTKNGRATLDEQKIKMMRLMYPVFSLSRLSKVFDIGKTQAHRIVTNQQWTTS